MSVKTGYCHGSTPNIARTPNGTAYYALTGKGYNLPCSWIEDQVANRLASISVSAECLPIMRELFYSQVENQDLSPEQELERLHAVLHDIDIEERSGMRLYLKGEVSENLWSSYWRDWQDRRNAIHRQIALLSQSHSDYADNFEEYLAIFSQLPALYGTLSEEMQQQLLRAVVKSVVVDKAGILLEFNLHSPFADLANLLDEAKKTLAQRNRMKNATHIVGGVPSSDDYDAQPCSRQFLLSWESRTYSEHPESSSLSQDLAAIPQNTQFPHRAKLLSLILAKKTI